jgi:ABC-2 type transport system permease protein
VRATLAIFKRELLSLWLTPLAWVLLVTFLILQGGMFYSIVVHFSQMEGEAGNTGPLQAYFGQQSLLMALTLLLLCPALTMRTLAEERRTGSIEALLSAPVSSGSIVVGKYLGSLTTYLLIWSPTFLYAATLRNTGAIHLPLLASGYLGIFLVGAAYLALGILMSAMAKSQLVALLLTSSLIFCMFILGIGEYIFESEALRRACGYISLTSTLEETAQGLIDSRRLVFYLSLTLWGLFVSERVVESWRSP